MTPDAKPEPADRPARPQAKRRWYQFSLQRLLVTLVIVSACFALIRPLGSAAFYGGAIVASCLASLALFGSRRDVVQAIRLYLGILGGGTIGIIFLHNAILTQFYQYDHGYGESDKSMLAAAVIGAIAGVAAVKVPWRLFPSSKDRSK